MANSYPFFEGPPTGTPTAPPRPVNLSPGQMFGSVSPPPRQSPSASTSRYPHRHSAAVERAMDLLKRETDLSKGKGKAKEQGIIASLETAGWSYESTTDGIRIFSKPSDANEARSGGGEREGTFVSQRSVAGGRGRSQRQGGGIRVGEDLPRWRGEGWLEGSWQLEDVAQTLVSAGARAVWDPRFDSLNSGVIALLSPTDQLARMHIRAELGADRDACLVSSIEHDDEQDVCYVMSTSVEDPLIPVVGTRTTIHLNGYCLRALPRSPYFEAPPVKSSSDPPPPSRPGHRRLKSSMSITGPMSPTYMAPPLPPLADSGFPFQPRTPGAGPFSAPFSPPPAMGARLPSDDGDSRRDDDSEMNPFDIPQYIAAPVKPKPPVEPSAPSTQPGIHCSFIVHVSPGFNLPQTTVNQLSVHLPLSIAALGRYLLVHGFCPYIVQQPRGLEIMHEQFEAVVAHYRVVYRVTEMGEKDTKIRFFGGTFAKGRFDVEVEGADDGWRLEYDVEPDPDNRPTLRRREDSEDQKENAGLRPRPCQSRKSSLSVLASSLIATAPLTADGPPPSDPPTADPARLPGPLGGCTLLIPNSPSTLHHPITITISKNAEAQSRPLHRIQRMSRALGRALRKSEVNQFDTVEELLERSSGDGRAELCLQGAREAMMEIRRAKEEERGEDTEVVAAELAEGLGHHSSVAFEEVSGEIDEQARLRRRRSSASLSVGLGLEGIRGK